MPISWLIWVMPPVIAAGKARHQQALDVGRQARPAEADRDAGMAHRAPDDGELDEAGRQHAPGEHVADRQLVGAVDTRHRRARAIRMMLRKTGATAAAK